MVDVEADAQLTRILRNLSDGFMSPVRQVVHSQIKVNELAKPTNVLFTHHCIGDRNDNAS